MKPANTEIVALIDAARLSGDPLVYADCYTIITIAGDRFFYTAAQESVIGNSLIDGESVEFIAGGLLITGLKSRLSIGVNVDEQDIEIASKPTDLIYGIPFVQAAQLGVFDGGIIRRDRYFFSKWGTPTVGGIPMFIGRMSMIDEFGRQVVKLKAKSYIVLLNINMPKELYQPSCINTLYDSQCKLNKNLFAVHDVVGPSPSDLVIPWASSTTDYSKGFIVMENGPTAGEQRTIKQSTSSALILAYPLTTTPGVGDMFTVYPGCDKTKTRCTSFFNNLINFRGFPFMPNPETAF